MGSRAQAFVEEEQRRAAELQLRLGWEEEARLRREREKELREEEERRWKEAEARRSRERQEREEELQREEAERARREAEAEEERAAEEARLKQLKDEEEQTQREEEEARELQLREAAFWASIAPQEAEQLRGLLQGVTLYQQQLLQSERKAHDLKQHLSSKEKACSAQKRRCYEANQEASKAKERHMRLHEEMTRWERKRNQCEEGSEGVQALRLSCAALQAELKQLKEIVAPLQEDRRKLRARVIACEESSQKEAQHLVDFRAQSQQAIAALKAEQVGSLAKLEAEHTEDLARFDVEWQAQVTDLRVSSAEDSVALRRALEDVQRRRERLQQERESASDQLLTRQREGARLQHQCTEARQEVTELYSQLKSVPVNLSHSVSQAHLPTRNDLSIVSLQEAQSIDAEIAALKQRCKVLEAECGRMHVALERGQAACERWRRRSMGHPSKESLLSLSQVGLTPRPVPFALGPEVAATNVRSGESHVPENQQLLALQLAA